MVYEENSESGNFCKLICEKVFINNFYNVSYGSFPMA